MELIITFLIICVFNILLSVAVTRKKPDGVLKLVAEADSEEPYLFLELHSTTRELAGKRQAIFLVDVGTVEIRSPSYSAKPVTPQK